MGLPYTFTAGNNAVAAEVNANFSYMQNIYHQGSNMLIGKNGAVYIPVIINNAVNTPDVYLELWGKAAGASATSMVHGASEHQHSETHSHTLAQAGGLARANTTSAAGGASSGYIGSVGGGSATYSDAILYTSVPQSVQIWIDGTEYTATIGNPNGKSSDMWDSGGEDWGNLANTAWDTGSLNISSVITWTAGLHYIEIKETAGTGGVLIYHVSVNSGYRT